MLYLFPGGDEKGTGKEYLFRVYAHYAYIHLGILNVQHGNIALLQRRGFIPRFGGADAAAVDLYVVLLPVIFHLRRHVGVP